MSELSEDVYSGSFVDKGEKPPRVEILRGMRGPNPYFKKGSFGYVVGVNTKGGVYLEDTHRHGESLDMSKPGEAAFLVSKTPTVRGGALWFSAPGLRFTQAPKDPVKALSDEERVALDIFLANGNGNRKILVELVPDASRRGYLKILATQMKSLRAR